MLTQAELIDTLTAVAEHGDTASAAYALCLDPSTVRYRLQRLQAQHKRPLFVTRQAGRRRGVGGYTRLTADGRRLLNVYSQRQSPMTGD